MKVVSLIFFCASWTLCQTPTTGRIAGTVTDQKGAVIVAATVEVTSQATADKRIVTTDRAGNFNVPLLSPGSYHVRINAAGFNPFQAETIIVRLTESTALDVVLTIAGITDAVTIGRLGPLGRTDNPTLGLVLNERELSELPLGSRNFTQLLALSAGTSTYLVDNTLVGRNVQSVSVNGSRPAQNGIQINGIDVAGASSYILPLPLPMPALESIAELKIQTSLYDASFGRAGGASVQAITKSGSNKFSGSVYDYFRNTQLSANNPFLKAVGVRRPVLERNVFGFVFGGAIRKNRAFFFGSFQTTRERNGASRANSLSVNVLTDPRLTDDRSDATLRATYPSIGITAMELLKAQLPNGHYLIPSPQVNGRYSGSAISRSAEDQFNDNFDFRLSRQNWLSVRFFLAHAPTDLARVGAINVPGFAVDQIQEHHTFSVQDVHNFSTGAANELRFGYNFVRADNFTDQPFPNSTFDINRPFSDLHPGLPAITINQNAGGIQFGTAALQSSLATALTTSLFDAVSVARGNHALRFGAEIRDYESNFNGNVLTHGLINFATFGNFLTGLTQTAQIGFGIPLRKFRTTDYNFFVQEVWKVSPKLTLDLGLRYELDLPPYEKSGLYGAFDPSLYRPRYVESIDGSRTPIGPPDGGFVQASNAAAGYDLASVPNVSKRILNGIDPNNFAPRFGFAFLPFKSAAMVLRGGYGIFYSRPSFQNAAGASYTQPFYFIGTTFNKNVSDPFAGIDSTIRFPDFVPGPPLSGNTIDRNNQTPYIEQYNLGTQFELSKDVLLEVAYVGTRGRKLLHSISINQGRLASELNPIRNEVTGQRYTTNLPADAALRAPFQGVLLGSGFVVDKSTGISAYNSLQASLTKRFSNGLQFLFTYTFAKSIDDGSATGGGSGTTGLINAAQGNDTNTSVINSLNGGAERGVSDFDRTHRFVASFLWELPKPAITKRSKMARLLLASWQVSGIVTAMSGLPIDIIDSMAGTLYVGTNVGGSRPNYVSGISPMSNIPPGYYFNPYAFARPVVIGGRVIPSSNAGATAGSSCPLIQLQQIYCTDFGNVGRNSLRGPNQFNTDVSISHQLRFDESRNIELRAEIFNLFNNVNFANPISNFNAVISSGGAIDQNNGQILPGRAGDFGRIISAANNSRIIQLALKFSF